MIRKGYTRVPNLVFADERLKANHLALLLRLASHAPGYVIRSAVEMAALGISEPTFLRVKSDLTKWGYITAKRAYVGGRVAGLYIAVSWPKLTPKTDGLVNGPKPSETKPRNMGVLKKDYSKEVAQNFDVIDDGDVVGLPSRRKRSNG